MNLRSQRARLPLVTFLLVVVALSAWQIVRQVSRGNAEQALEAALAQRRYGEAQVLLADQLRSRPNDPRLHLFAARFARRQYDLKLASRELELCLANGGDKAEVGFEQGLAEIQLGVRTHAPEYFRICSAAPEAPEAALIVEALVEGCLLARDTQSLATYLDFWEKHFVSDADRSQAQLWRGKARKLQRDSQGEKRAYEQAVELDPQNRAARLALAQRLLDDDPQAAAQHLAILQNQTSDDAEVAYHAALLERNLGRLSDALRKLDGVLQRQPRHVEALVLRGRIALEQGRELDAKNDLLAAERLSPQHPAVLQAMIDYLRCSGQEEECERYRQRVADIKSAFEQQLASEKGQD